MASVLRKGTYKSGTEDDKSGLAGAAVGGLDDPFPSVCVEVGSNNYSVEGAVLLDIHDLVHMVKVRPDLLVIRVICCPVPVLIHLRPGELVLGDSRVDTCSRIAVESPGTSQVIAGFEENSLEAALSEPLERENAAWTNTQSALVNYDLAANELTEATSNDYDIHIKVVGVWSGVTLVANGVIRKVRLELLGEAGRWVAHDW